MLEACTAANMPCAIFTNTVDAAIRRRREGYALVVVANDIDVLKSGFSAAVTRFNEATLKADEDVGGADFARAKRRRTSTP